MKQEQVKVICLNCKKIYHVPDYDVPDEAEEGEAFFEECPYCHALFAEIVD